MEMNLYAKLWHAVKAFLKEKNGDLPVAPTAYPLTFPQDYAQNYTCARHPALGFAPPSARATVLRADPLHRQGISVKDTAFKVDERKAARGRLLACHYIDDYDVCPTDK